MQTFLFKFQTIDNWTLSRLTSCCLERTRGVSPRLDSSVSLSPPFCCVPAVKEGGVGGWVIETRGSYSVCLKWTRKWVIGMGRVCHRKTRKHSPLVKQSTELFNSFVTSKHGGHALDYFVFPLSHPLSFSPLFIFLSHPPLLFSRLRHLPHAALPS